ncbi:alpha/beta hydrolase [Kibdelosporangium philippinense]|uniref:Alpha/beta hydrolase n=1 Tax=Kibdelosporangium philippinense TaxID=211113 RepID=A0ABS8ZAS8_9PSEU|nr:alpha/beta fold hydrolase [Kibdelosporangium philippinense]MCE7003910.1 alpha/beta hydrolase [Kibdelosporangium philippinense]
MISRLVAVALLSVTLLTPGGVATADPDSPSCVQADVPVHTLTVSGAMHGTLCQPAGPASDTVMVLVPGATYNSVYWDFPYQLNTYSFTKAMTAGGYATFALDRLGTGQSTRPLSVQLTTLTQADAVHDVIQALRAGAVGGTAFSKVILGGHSLGSVIAAVEAATFHDVDAVLITGASHQPNAINAAALLTVHTASVALLPGFPNHDAGYFTTVPGHRKPAFHDPDFVDPAALALDEATKDVVSYTEAPDGFALGVFTPYSALINVPVLVANGQRDSQFCGALAQCNGLWQLQESLYYLGSPALSFYLLPTAGHSINYNPDAPLLHAAVLNWANSL